MMRVREFAGVALVAMVAMSAAFWIQRLESNPAAQAVVAEWIPSFAKPALAAEIKPAPAPVRVASSAPVLQIPVTPTTSSPGAKPSAITADPAPTPVPVDNAYLQADAVAERVKESVPSQLFPYFDVYLYVSKAAHGAWAQHMFVYHRTDSGRLAFEEAFPVSTGRERSEKYFTTTPAGLFELDPNRFDANHRSHRWHNAPMPWAMFLNYTTHNHLAGIALHSGVGHVALLGQRASGGCVRMPPQKAEEYFHRFQASERGQVPVFAFDGAIGTTRTDGTLQVDPAGGPRMAYGYKVLLIIQDYPGGPAMVAVLS
jgi:lipoprotein-anchoring transpeptidase ErfK/SrfK